ncbi:MAG: hypothetical protein P1V97_38400 [Planctomycetota bacterium]|nr:hypothetical protein [Planctomycetota bacterium]
MRTVHATYRVKSGSEAAFEELLEKHWPTLSRLSLVTEEPAQCYRQKDEQGRTSFVEVFTWREADSPGVAHNHPEVSAIWEPMGALCEARDGRESMEFPHFERFTPGQA